MTKKELNTIRTGAYTAWIATEDGQRFIESPYACCKCWRISEGEKRELWITYHDTQINAETLRQKGFSKHADVCYLFEVNRKTKTLTPCGW